MKISKIAINALPKKKKVNTVSHKEHKYKASCTSFERILSAGPQVCKCHNHSPHLTKYFTSKFEMNFFSVLTVFKCKVFLTVLYLVIS